MYVNMFLLRYGVHSELCRWAIKPANEAHVYFPIDQSQNKSMLTCRGGGKHMPEQIDVVYHCRDPLFYCCANGILKVSGSQPWVLPDVLGLQLPEILASTVSGEGFWEVLIQEHLGIQGWEAKVAHGNCFSWRMLSTIFLFQFAGEFLLDSLERISVVELLYLGETVSMFVVLPSDRRTPLGKVEVHLSSRTFLLLSLIHI